jgi:hypothetical protein
MAPSRRHTSLRVEAVAEPTLETGFDANPHLARFRLGIGRFFDDWALWWALLRNPDLPHGRGPSEIKSLRVISLK